MPTEAYVYTRQSQADDELAVDRQYDECISWMETKGFTVREHYEDNDKSATKANVVRPDFERLLRDCAANPAPIVCWHTDRFWRVLRDLARVIELNVDVYGLHAGHIDLSTPAGRAVAVTLTAWQTYEGEQKAERQKAANRQRVAAGRPFWPRGALGYREDRSVNESEARPIREAYTAVLSGQSLTSITGDWNARGFYTRDGNRWRVSSLRKLLLAERNAGILTYNGAEAGRGDWEPLVDEETFRGVQRVLSANTASPGPRTGMGGRASLLTGFAECSVCEGKVRSKTVKDYRRYQCKAGHASARADWVDERAAALIVERFSRPDVIGSLVAPAADAGDLQAELDKLRLRGKRYAAMLDDDEIDFDQFGELNRSNRARIAEVEAELGKVGAASALVRLLSVDDLAHHWHTELSLPQQHAIVEAFYDRIVIHPRQHAEMRQGDVEFWPKGLGRAIV